MNLDLLTAISPIDGRYRGKTEQLANYFSEYALISYRVRVEIEYFITPVSYTHLDVYKRQVLSLLRHSEDIYKLIFKL